MGNVLSYLMTLKKFVVGKELGEASPPEFAEVDKIQIYHDKWAERIKIGCRR
jgi:hypothetical protein